VQKYNFRKLPSRLKFNEILRFDIINGASAKHSVCAKFVFCQSTKIFLQKPSWTHPIHGQQTVNKQIKGDSNQNVSTSTKRYPKIKQHAKMFL